MQLGTRVQQTNPPNLGAEARHGIQVLQQQQSLTPFPYYSTVQFTAAANVAPPGPFTYTIPAGTQARAFSYARGAAAGALANALPRLGAAGGTATECETNLINASQTISGQNVYIHGLAINYKHGSLPGDGNFSDARLAAQLDTNAHVSLSLNGGDNRFLCGGIQQIPSAGGTRGRGYDSLGTPALEGGTPEFSFFSNGWETRSNFFRLPAGLVWRAQGETNSDSHLEIPLTVCRDITLFSGGNPANNIGDVVPAATVQAYNFPLQIECNYTVFLIGEVIGPRTRSGT